MNKVELIGRLTRKPELKDANGTSVVKGTIACDRRYKKEGGDQADFISYVAFGKTAEFMAKYLDQGSKIGVEGRIQTGSYEKDGNKVYTTDVVVEAVEFCDSKASGNKAEAEPVPPVEAPAEAPVIPADLDDVLPF